MYVIFSIPMPKTKENCSTITNTDIHLTSMLYITLDAAIKASYDIIKMNKYRQICTSEIEKWIKLPVNDNFIKFYKKDGIITYKILKTKN